MKLLEAALAAGLAGIASAAQLSCYEDPATNKNTCYDPSKVRQNGDLRAVTIYSGGPAGVRQTPFTMVVDCAKRITTLQDRQGVNFAGAQSDASKPNRALAGWICEEPKTRPDKSLRQFSK